MSDIDEMLGFNPQDLDVFQEKPSGSYDANVYKTNPKDSKSESGQYISKVKIIYNPFDVKQSVVHQATYAMNDEKGFFLVKSKLGNGDKSCPIFRRFMKMYYSGDENKKQFAREMFDKTESNWVLVQILEDDNKPDLVGQFKFMKLPKDIYDKMAAKMNPAPETKKSPVPVMDYLIGLPLEINVTPGPDDPSNPKRKQREISYSLCGFSDEFAPIIRTDGTPLFTDEEYDVIDSYVTARANLSKPSKKAAAEKEIESLSPTIKALYRKALDYVKENAPDLVKECSFQEWDQATTERVNNWLDIVESGQDPKTVSTNPLVAAGEEVLKKNYDNGANDAPSGFDPNFEAAASAPSVGFNSPTDDLPF